MPSRHVVNRYGNKAGTDEYTVLRDVIEPVRDMHVYLPDAEGVRFLVDCQDNLVVETDCLRLQQCLVNLVRNSARSLHSGFIRIRAAIVDNSVEVSVEDSGPGIPEEKRTTIFDKYETGADRLNEGTSVGFYLCWNVVSRLNGVIYLDGTYDSGIPGSPGARFVVKLSSPLLEQPLDRIPVNRDEKLGIVNDEETYKLSESECLELPENVLALFVDDDKMLRKLFSRAVKGAAPTWTGHEASDGETALRLVEEGTAASSSYDLIFMDQHMSTSDAPGTKLLGTETVRALRAKGVASIICGLSANDVEEAFFDAGVDFFLTKPFPCEQFALRQELLRIMRQSPRRRGDLSR